MNLFTKCICYWNAFHFQDIQYYQRVSDLGQVNKLLISRRAHIEAYGEHFFQSSHNKRRLHRVTIATLLFLRAFIVRATALRKRNDNKAKHNYSISKKASQPNGSKPSSLKRNNPSEIHYFTGPSSTCKKNGNVFPVVGSLSSDLQVKSTVTVYSLVVGSGHRSLKGIGLMVITHTCKRKQVINNAAFLQSINSCSFFFKLKWDFIKRIKILSA